VCPAWLKIIIFFFREIDTIELKTDGTLWTRDYIPREKIRDGDA